MRLLTSGDIVMLNKFDLIMNALLYNTCKAIQNCQMPFNNEYGDAWIFLVTLFAWMVCMS